MEDEVHPPHRLLNAPLVAYVADLELEFGAAVAFAHVVLLLLVAAKDADLADTSTQKAIQDSVAEGAGASRDQEGIFLKETSNSHLFSSA
jgi:hypothetical protein